MLSLDETFTEIESNCLSLYGKKTCILRQISENDNEKKYVISWLDRDGVRGKASSSDFYALVPYLLSLRYTVVIVERVAKTNQIDIKAVHFPEGAGKLLTPVWPV